MAEYRLTLVDADDAALTWFVTAHINPARVANGLPAYADNQAFVADRMRELLQPVRANFDAADVESLVALYRQAPLALRARAKAALRDLDGPEPETP